MSAFGEQPTMFFALWDVKRWYDAHAQTLPTVDDMERDLYYTRDFAQQFLDYASQVGWITALSSESPEAGADAEATGAETADGGEAEGAGA